ncbi:hypothetical protein DPEC_G00124580 [Dallia pectoralis]|uniref:Uncharacterized protein n=1 Tax=Dallia pectoralis TaxID=75939 RepID=A0ACC2GRP2_DALPE|nr:hypothetical protein DPEC_G00124580 [Dallia pectoralis]
MLRQTGARVQPEAQRIDMEFKSASPVFRMQCTPTEVKLNIHSGNYHKTISATPKTQDAVKQNVTVRQGQT